MIGAVIQILGGCLVLAWGCCAALNYRGTAEYPLQANVDWRRKHPRFDRCWAGPGLARVNTERFRALAPFVL
jgi:hypothetical protein